MRGSIVAMSMVIGFLAVLCGATLFASGAQAEPFNLGPKKCQECHKDEFSVWEGTPHAKSFKTIHKSDKAKKIAKTITGSKNMKKSEICMTCHYTPQRKEAGGKISLKAGPSCESCHGAASDWVAVHNNYGGPSVKQADETPENKAKRIAAAEAAGMNWSFQKYGAALKCNACHGLANDKIDDATLTKMVEAEHPMKHDFELVAYSQGAVRHRFYPPDMTTNAEMSDAQLAMLYVQGQAAKLVVATKAGGRSVNAAYKAFQQKRAADAAAALKSVSGSAALIANPTDDNARKFLAGLDASDAASAVGGALPSKSSYK